VLPKKNDISNCSEQVLPGAVLYEKSEVDTFKNKVNVRKKGKGKQERSRSIPLKVGEHPKYFLKKKEPDRLDKCGLNESAIFNGVNLLIIRVFLPFATKLGTWDQAGI
jgi:hypothetical protein